MPGQGMARMIQMLTSLAEMQDRRRKLTLEEDTFEESKKQFAQQMGYNEKGQHQALLFKTLDRIAQGGAEGAAAAQQLSQLPDFSPEEKQVILHSGANAGAALQMIQQQAQQYALQQQQAGFNSMTPQMQQQGQQAAYLANQANTNAGGLATSNLQANMANTPLSPDFARRVGEGYVMRQATGETPFGFQVGQAGIDQGMAPAAAGIGAGINPSWMNQAQDAYWRGSLMNDANANATRGTPRMAPADLASLMNTAHAIAKDMAEGKYADKKLRAHMMAQYNAMAPVLGLPLMTDTTAPEKTGAIMQGINKIGGINGPGIAPVDTVKQTPTAGGIYRPPNFY